MGPIDKTGISFQYVFFFSCKERERVSCKEDIPLFFSLWDSRSYSIGHVLGKTPERDVIGYNVGF